jgi:predicted transcriptional regulator
MRKTPLPRLAWHRFGIKAPASGLKPHRLLTVVFPPLILRLQVGKSLMRHINPKIALRGFKPSGRGPGHVLGELESAVMEVLWATPQQTVNEVEEKLARKRDIAHTTVLTTLDRMFRKGYLIRDKQGKAFVYSARYSRDEFERGMAQEVLGALLNHYRTPALSAFVDLVGENEHTLDQLEEMIREKRRQGASRKEAK